MNREYLDKIIKLYLNKYDESLDVEWNDIFNDIINYDIMVNNEEFDKNILGKIAILKLNGGLGTTMNCKKAKSLMEVKNGYNFLDIFINQIININDRYNSNIPLILMNSFYTNDDINDYIYRKKYNDKIDIITFNQTHLPRLDIYLNPIKKEFNINEREYWYPPGHGDFYYVFCKSGLKDEMIKRGIEYIFISNSDNLCATLDFYILNYIIKNNIDFLAEITEKTINDIKGGSYVKINNRIKLVEIAQIPENKVNDFINLPYFNTNNLWLNINNINDDMDLDIIYNPKVIENGQKIVQLETAICSGIKNFNNPKLLLVDRNRFLPIKKFENLYELQNNYYIDSSFNVLKYKLIK